MQYTQALEWIDSTVTKGIKLGLDSPRELVERMEGMPANGASVIHVAGTNGKGSTSVFLESVLRAHGYRVGLFTSPHLVKLNERFQINRENVSDEKLAALISEAKVCCEAMEVENGHHPTFFEIGVGLAMRWFLSENVDFIILETGMGGRLDATSVVPSDYQIITPIAMDHQEYLGDSLEKIAGEKAGIIRERANVIWSPQEPDAEKVLRDCLQEKEATQLPFTRLPSSYSVELGIPGSHQYDNAGAALIMAKKVLDDCGEKVNSSLVEQAFSSVFFAARFQRLMLNKYKEGALREERMVLVDGAHNSQSISSFLTTWEQTYSKQKVILIFGALADKNAVSSLCQLTVIAKEIHLVPVNNDRLMKPHKLEAGLSADWRERAVLHPTLDSAFELVLLREPQEIPVVVVGSLYLAGEALSLLL